MLLPSYLQLRWNPPIQIQFTIIDRETHREKKFIKIEKTDVKTKTKKYRKTEIKKKRTTGGLGGGEMCFILLQQVTHFNAGKLNG